MVSRIVATRAALTKDADCAYEQINYQLSGSTLSDVIKILTGIQDKESEELTVPDQSYSTRALQKVLRNRDGKTGASENSSSRRLFPGAPRACFGRSQKDSSM